MNNVENKFESIIFNKDLCRKIIEYTGPLVKKRCIVCDCVIEYQILTLNIVKENKKIINLQACDKYYVCSEECYEIENIERKNIKCILALLIFTIMCIFLLIIVMTIL